MNFILTPPIVMDNGFGFSLIQIGTMELPESLIIEMSGWSALDLLIHWRFEIEQVLAGNRDRCCIVTGLARRGNSVILPSEWWVVYQINDQTIFHYQVLQTKDLHSRDWKSPGDWWRNIPGYSTSIESDGNGRRVSEWTVSMADLGLWCKQYDVLINAIQAIDIEAE